MYIYNSYITIYRKYYILLLVSVATRSKEWDCGLLLTGTVGSNPAGALMSVCLL
jgi:hypothetical protein